MNRQPGLRDTYNRTINYLRLSVTDRCNLRCFYCMPSEGVTDVGHHGVLSLEELLLIAQCAVGLGIEKVRITGGEPTVRSGLIPFLAELSAIPGLRHLALTTNGLLLKQLAADLYRSGVQRLNVSLDSLNPATFREITRGGDLRQVLDGLDAAVAAGFPPPKINVVIMRGINDAEILDFAELTISRGCSVRFIEYMPVVKDEGWQRLCFAGHEVLQRISERHTLDTVEKGAFSGPSQDYRIPGAPGTIGIITAVSGHFCTACNRIRVTARGQAKGCLFSDARTDLLPFLRPPDRERLSETLRQIVAAKPEGHSIRCGDYDHQNFSMAQIGG